MAYLSFYYYFLGTYPYFDLLSSLPKTIAALHAGSEYAGVPVNNCVLITGSQSGVAGAERVGMPYVVLHSR